MYTRCPSCSSTFRVTAAVLHMAAGEVRCGSCGSVFNALDTLVDDWTDTHLMMPAAPGLSAPQTPVPAPVTPPAAAAQDESGAVEAALEFNVPENEWQHFFLTPQGASPLAAARPEPALGEDFDELAQDAATPPATPPTIPPLDEPADEPAAAPLSVGTLEEETADTDTWQGFLREAGLEPVLAEDADADLDAADETPLFVLGDEPGQDGPGNGPDGREEDGIEPDTGDRDESGPDREAAVEDPTGTQAGVAAVMVAGAAPETVLDWGPPPPFSTRPATAPGHAGRWFAASLVAAFMLGAQWLHHFRDDLATNPAYGGVVRSAYGRLGLPLAPGWPLETYEVRSVKALMENSPQGALDIVAEIAVTGHQSVGLPLLRVVLRDRWSNTVASGVFDPTEYLAEAPPPGALYAPGTLIPVQLSLADPGAAAQGFELDVCMPNRHYGLQCQTAHDPFRR